MKMKNCLPLSVNYSCDILIKIIQSKQDDRKGGKVF